MTSSDDDAVTPELLLKAYACGIFPMAESQTGDSVHWIDPTHRGVILFDRFHVPRRLARTMRQNPFEIRFDTNFEQVLTLCAQTTQSRQETWINGQIHDLYLSLFEMGYGHSVEAWHEGELVGGLYGISLGGAFFGESMFSRRTDASKIALVYLCHRLLRGGYSLLDTQFLTSHLTRFGAFEISRARYHSLLRKALKLDGDFHCGGVEDVDSVLQSFSQTS
ncbi:leucyl/phenylalanyl-tRNA--protein transferase [Aureimonas fodinaquatilis]|uniref:Leucyl/phenylalanyl-tRNA--protein transferase n=1 Tax=Aureimonas fodinaquatilis TaxID=2565783 RepID=A0A5B0DW91_9HYPH|nr:leucyl/phenylalanyl-tRNA--protein transferase [Aureimonas fodinaquatilis]KAA0970145.1 leucyl/phenylalanyl-tRNA--protein transferase [Aureimonas fodinaquatilis]